MSYPLCDVSRANSKSHTTCFVLFALLFVHFVHFGFIFPVAVQGNNEVSMWDMETGDRRFTLWASSAPPLSELQVWSLSFPVSVV